MSAIFSIFNSMKRILIAMLLVSKLNYSQEKIPFVDYEQIIKKFSKEESNEKKLALINQISKNDSAYYSLLRTKSYYLIELEKYEEALKTVNEGINNKNLYPKVDLYINKGIALSSLKRNEEALENYNVSIKLYPKNYSLWFNKGYVLETQGKLNKAVNAYKTAITLNPSSTKTHLRIGNIYYKQKRLTQALMCFNMCLLLKPDSEEAFSILKLLNRVVKSKNNNKRDHGIILDDEDDSFEDIDLVLSSKIAMNANYKTGNSINIALTKQNHVMIEQLKNFETKDGFWSKTYLPFYKWIAANNKFNDFIYTLTYSIKKEEYKKIIKKNTKNIIAFLADSKKEWIKNVSKNNIFFNGKQQDVTFEYEDFSYVTAIGKKEAENFVGFWQFYSASGNLMSEGSFDNSGKKTGKWTWYTSLNKIKETAFYKKGLLEGENIIYHKNGKKYVNAFYKKNSLQGQYEYFNNKGALKQRKHFKANNLHGVYKSYFNVGEKIIEYNIPYKNGQVEGEVLEYYTNGDLYEKSFYVNGKINGLKTTYHYNKKISSEINYINGKLNGSYKSYHSNGKIHEVGQSVEGYYNGAWKNYYSNGSLESEFTYKKGILDGLCKYYDRDGKLFYEYVYKKGEIIAYTFYNKDASILKKAKKKKGDFYYEGFSPKGNKTTEGLYDISGGKIGEWKFYSHNGVLKNKGNFNKNKINGNYFSYYKNGNLKDITSYKEDVVNGYYVAYFLNKKMSNQGWYKQGKKHGEWRYYYLDGTIKAINFFHKGMLQGVQKYYGVEGKLMSSTLYNFNHLISENIYDKDEVLFEKINFTSKENEYEITHNHYNGKLKTKISFVNEVKHGSYQVFHFNGNKEVTGSYFNGAQDGLWTWYYENGDVESKATYFRGKKHGKIINSYKNGKIEGVYTYKNDLDSKTSLNYYQNGVKETSTEYYEGKNHGRKEFYDRSGKLQLIRFYNHGEIIGYSYLNKNGTEVAMIPLPKESGKIEAFFDNGKPSKTMEYKFGDLVNSYKTYYYNGNLEEEITFIDGEYHNIAKQYFLNGNLKKETSYNYGEKHGKQIVYFENGNKKEEKMFLNNLEHGMCFFYNKKGKLKTKKEYFNGKIYKVKNL